MVRLFSLGLALAGALTLAACGGGGRTVSRMPPATLTQIGVNSYLWRAAIDTVSFAPITPPAESLTQIGVNSYLWRAAIDTVSFAPIAQTDSAGGVIVTEWYANPSDPTDRVKVSVAILDATLRADALRVTAARQRLQNGQWIDAPVSAATVQRLEEIILTRARDLRRGARVG